MAEICGDPFSGIGCPIPGCTHDGPDAALQYHVVLAERECDQLRAERDQALELLREVRDECAPPLRYIETARVRRLIDQSGLLDDEGQQR